jgi:hypothetical protein
MTARIEAAEALIQESAFGPITDAPIALSRAVANLEAVRQLTHSCPESERAALLNRLKGLQAKLRLFSAGMERSAVIFRGCCRAAGVSCEEYTPGGVSALVRDPAFFTLNV